MKMTGLFLSIVLTGIMYMNGVECPLDNMSMYFTGKTRTEMGKMLYEYKCPSGHVTWVVQ